MKPIIGKRPMAIGCALALTGCLGCSTPPPPSPQRAELSRLTTAARMAYEQGSVSQSARLYVRALKMARTQDNPVEIGNNAYNLAACLIGMGKYGEARALLAEARREFERSRRPATMILLLDAKAARLQGEADEALALADLALASLIGGDRSTYPLQVALLKTQIACDRGDIALSKDAFAGAVEALRGIDDAILRAEAAGTAGRIALLEGDSVRAAQEYDRQADYCSRAGKYRDMAMALGRAGQAYLDADMLLPAADRFYRSARSLHGQGDTLSAVRMVGAALVAGAEAGDQDSLARSRALFDEISTQVEAEKDAGLDGSKLGTEEAR